MKSIPLIILILLTTLLALGSCGDRQERQAKRMGKGFRLPEGNEEAGKAAFLELRCHRCHSVVGIELPDVTDRPGDLDLTLGGEVRKVKTYGQLVTAIIQPQHIVSRDYLKTLKKDDRADAPSPMPNHNTTMTVQQLTDLVSFLHARYQKVVPQYDDPTFGGP